MAIGLQAFNACSGLETVNLPNAISIGNSAFLNCSALTTVDISGVTGTLGNNTFKNCSALTTLNVSGATIAGNNTFENTGTLANADFSSLVSLGAQTFRKTAAVALSFPTLTHVGNASDPTSGLVFWQASNLKTIDFPMVEVINTGAFNSCPSLESITFPATLTSLTENNYNMFKGCTSLANVIVEYTTFIPLEYNPDGSSVNTSIFADVFGATLTIPSSVNATDYTTGDVWKDFGAPPVLNVNTHEAAQGWDFYPNPAKDVVTIQNIQSQHADITVFDLNGRILLNKTINNVQSEINMSSLNTGIYLFQVKTDAGAFVKRIAKQ
ncbi:cell surface protein [Algibacter lectus]|uniref:Cell surface protein n=1 Tax=Algibacter lectus TaxID=221126 RepID=A0A090WVR6_9FLAO|nr:cell surface protein [Algibacter lectus]